MSKILKQALRDLDQLPESERARITSMLADEVQRARHSSRIREGRWARVADRLAAANALDECSDDLVRHVRAFRDNFALGEPNQP
ncbi:MAG: hypothetical protein R3D25_21890 [Geminicoccaceae bacterium]